MENLNAEQVKRGLERCANEWHCGLCGFTEKECALIKKSALALINSQEQRIKELTQANEQLSESYDHLEKTKDEFLSERSSLTEENESLKTQRRVLAVGLKDLRKEIKAIKADTVRKMQERLKSEIAKYFLPTFQFQANAFIDQIAKEMLKGENNE